MTTVVDSSVVVAALTQKGRTGRWSGAVVAEGALAAPHLMPVEVAEVLRRSSRANLISADAASLAHRDLTELMVKLHPYDAHAGRVWQLRANVTAYDAWYIALAEELEAPLATLDGRLMRAPGTRCEFLVPPG